MTCQEAAPLRRIGKAHCRPKTVLRRREGRESAYRQRQRWIPQRGSRIAFTRHGDLVEQVGWLTVVRPGQAQVYGQAATDLPIVAAINKRVMLTEVERRISGSDLDPVWRIGNKAGTKSDISPAIKPVGSIDRRQEDVRGTLEGVIYASLEGVLAHNKVPVVLGLPGVYDSALRQVRGGANWKQCVVGDKRIRVRTAGRQES